MKNVTLLFLTIILFSCGHQSPKDKFQKELIQSDNDSLCIKEIEKAKTDLSNGRIVFCMPIGMGGGTLRQEKQIRQLCKKYNIVFKYEPISDVIIEGQTPECYGAYMDKIITEKFGSSFKENILNQADSILLLSNDTIESSLCDKRPQVLGMDEDFTLATKLNDELSKQLKSDEEGQLPFVDIGFYIDKNGNPSGYFLNFFSDADNKSNEKFKDELFKIGVKSLKQYKHWEPGQIKGQKVNTENNVRVYFLKSDRKFK